MCSTAGRFEMRTTYSTHTQTSYWIAIARAPAHVSVRTTLIHHFAVAWRVCVFVFRLSSSLTLALPLPPSAPAIFNQEKSLNIYDLVSTMKMCNTLTRAPQCICAVYLTSGSCSKLCHFLIWNNEIESHVSSAVCVWEHCNLRMHHHRCPDPQVYIVPFGHLWLLRLLMVTTHNTIFTHCESFPFNIYFYYLMSIIQCSHTVYVFGLVCGDCQMQQQHLKMALLYRARHTHIGHCESKLIVWPGQTVATCQS